MQQNNRTTVAVEVGSTRTKFATTANGKFRQAMMPTIVSKYTEGDIPNGAQLVFDDKDLLKTCYAIFGAERSSQINTMGGFPTSTACVATTAAMIHKFCNDPNVDVIVTKPTDVYLDASKRKNEPLTKGFLQKCNQHSFKLHGVTNPKVQNIKFVRVAGEALSTVANHLFNIDGTFKTGLENSTNICIDIGGATTQFVEMNGLKVMGCNVFTSINSTTAFMQLFMEVYKKIRNIDFLSNTEAYKLINDNQLQDKSYQDAFDYAVGHFKDALSTSAISARTVKDKLSTCEKIIVTGGLTQILGIDFYKEILGVENIILASPYANVHGALKIWNRVNLPKQSKG